MKITNSKAIAKSAKVNPAPLQKTGTQVTFVTIGSKGTVCFRGIWTETGVEPLFDTYGRSYRANSYFLKPEEVTGEPFLCEWKGSKGEQSALGKAIGAWVSNAGKPVSVLPLAKAIERKLVKAYAVKADGHKLTVFLPPADYKALPFPQILACDTVLGRIENYKKWTPKGANASTKFKAQAGCQRDTIELA